MKKRGTKKRSSPARLKWALIGLATLAGLFAMGLVRETIRSRQINGEIVKLQEEAESLRARNFEIANLTASLEDEEFLEREARLKLGLKKAGEEVVILKQDSPSSGIRRVSGASVDVFEKWSPAKKWWMYFSDRTRYDDYAVRRGFR